MSRNCDGCGACKGERVSGPTELVCVVRKCENWYGASKKAQYDSSYTNQPHGFRQVRLSGIFLTSPICHLFTWAPSVHASHYTIPGTRPIDLLPVVLAGEINRGEECLVVGR